MSKSNADYAVEYAQQLSRHDPQRSALIRMSMAIRDLQPQKRTWVGLTDVEWVNIVNKDQAWFGQRPDEVAHEVAKLVEAKLKEKNNG